MSYGNYTIPEGYLAERAVEILRDEQPIALLIECREDCEEDKGYLFVVDWDAYEEAKKHGMCDIPGIPETHEVQYFAPFLHDFLYRRFIPIDRPDWQYHYSKVGLKHQDQWEFIVRMKGRCNEDKFTVRPVELPCLVKPRKIDLAKMLLLE